MKFQSKYLLQGLSGVAFPKVCVCCGLETTRLERDICSFCLEEQFEEIDSEGKLQTSDLLLPAGVYAQVALWQFDKGGHLQDLMHYLKYERLTQIGRQLGERIGRKLQHHTLVAPLLDPERAILVPVPLHYLKFRSRGFNQAFEIARGMQSVLSLPVCPIRSVVRRRHTRSQTGLKLEDRIDNIKRAFRVRDPELFEDKWTVVVDDVFTTGTTTFELANVLLSAGAKGAIIATVAQA